MIPTLHIHLLGKFLLVSGETPVTSLDLPRLQSLLAYLVLRCTTPQSRSYLAYQFWPDSIDAQALTNLRNLVHKLRQTLPNADHFLLVERQTLSWLPTAPWTLDVLDFERALAQGEQAKHAKDRRSLRQALAKAVGLYQGDLLPACYDEWILPDRDRLRQAFLEALVQLVGLLDQERDYPAAIRHAQHFLHYDPLHEEMYRHLMRLYALSGDRAAALRTYHTCASVLERELATQPGKATRQAYEQLVQMRGSTGPLAEPHPLGAIKSLVGRNPEWAQLLAIWQRIAGGGPHMVVLTGEAGIGKTRLAEELLTWVERQGMATATARCYAAEGRLAYGPVATWLHAEALRATLSGLADVWLTEVARLLPALLVQYPELPRPMPLTEGWQRQHFFEGLARALLGSRRPLLLLLDDVQWSDHETLEWLHYLLRFDRQAPLLLVATLRPEEMTSEHPLTSLLESLRRSSQLIEIGLEPLDAEGTASLAAHVAGQDLSPDQLMELYQETEGNPLFVVETVRVRILAQERPEGHAVEAATDRSGSLSPSTIQSVIAARLAQLSPVAREVVSVAAVIGRAFTFQVLAQASAADEDALVAGLDELWQRRIVREQGSDAYDFSHDKLREGAYAALSRARRRSLHHRVAQAMEVLYVDNLDTHSGQIAAHYERADLPQRAIPYYERAAEMAQQVSANTEALVYFRRALALLDVVPSDAFQQDQCQQVRARLHERIGDMLEMTGRYEEARMAYRDALDQVSALDRLRSARLHRKSGDTWKAQQRCEEALHAYETAEAVMGKEPTVTTSEWWQEWIRILDGRGWVYYRLAQWQEIADLVARVRPIVEQHGTPAQLAEFFHGVYIMHARRERYVVSEETQAYAQMGLAASLKLEKPSEIALHRYYVGFRSIWHGELDEAEEHLHAALNLAERIGYTMVQSMCLNYLTMVYRKRGQVEAVREYGTRSLAAAIAEQKSQYVAMSKSNLAWLAWREGDLTAAREQGRAALTLWHQPPVVFMDYPFDWTALWPLIGTELVQEHLFEAIDYARALLSPTQQPPPPPLKAVVEAAIQAWDSGQQARTHSYLQQAATLAQEMGYL